MRFPIIKVKYKVGKHTLVRIVGTTPGDALYIDFNGAIQYVDLDKKLTTEPTGKYPDGAYQFVPEDAVFDEITPFIEMVELDELIKLQRQVEENDKLLRENEKLTREVFANEPSKK